MLIRGRSVFVGDSIHITLCGTGTVVFHLAALRWWNSLNDGVLASLSLGGRGVTWSSKGKRNNYWEALTWPGRTTCRNASSTSSPTRTHGTKSQTRHSWEKLNNLDRGKHAVPLGRHIKFQLH